MIHKVRNWLFRQFDPSRSAAGADGATALAPSIWREGIYREPRSESFMSIAGRDLHYRLYVPPTRGKSESLPLILMLHGCAQTAVELAEGTRMNQVAQERRCAVLYPEQARKANALRCWNWFDSEVLEGKGEAALLVDLVGHIVSHCPIDPARVYVAGLSAGGAMAAALCATHGNLFAACAIHSGLMSHAAATSLEAVGAMRSGTSAPLEQVVQSIVRVRAPEARLVPTLVIHGTDDEIVNPVNAEHIAEQLRMLALRAMPQGTAPTLGEARWAESGMRRYRQQDSSLAGTILVRTILVEGLGHAWSGGDGRHKFFDSAGPDSSRMIVQFLLEHRLPAESPGEIHLSCVGD